MKSSQGEGTPVRVPANNNIPAGSTSKHNGIKPKMTAKRRAILILLYILIVVFGLFAGGFTYFYINILGKIGEAYTPFVSKEDYDTIDFDSLDDFDADTSGDTSSSWADGGHTGVYIDADYPIAEVDQIDPDVENILVFGVDSRGTDDVECRADAVMIVSINQKTNTINLVSLMRDTGVTIQGRSSQDKLTHSYKYGGVGLLINTINENYGLDVQRFIMLDFSSAADVIDLVGGIDIDVQAEEVKYANQSINEENELMDSSISLLSYSGEQTLNGVQVIAWARIRHADSDFIRTSRQRTVATALISKVSSMSYLDQLAILEDSAGMFETNMTSMDLLRIATNAMGMADNIQQYRLPDDNMYTVQQDPWMMIVDWDAQLPLLKEYIWGDS